MWTETDIAFELIDDTTDHPVATLLVQTPMGRIEIMAELLIQGRILLLRGMHVGGSSPNLVGPGNLKLIARLLVERLDYNELVVEGAVRETGANPGRRPGAVRIKGAIRS